MCKFHFHVNASLINYCNVSVCSQVDDQKSSEREIMIGKINALESCLFVLMIIITVLSLRNFLLTPKCSRKGLPNDNPTQI